MRLRRVLPGDAAAVAAIRNDVIRETLVTFTSEGTTADGVAQEIEAAQSACLPWLVAERDGRLAGFARAGQFRAGPGYAHTLEHSVLLAADARGQGIGFALMTRLMEDARTGGAHVMVAAISGANPAAVAFHRRLGFVEVGRMPEVGRKWGRWLDLVLMQRILSGEKGAGAVQSATENL